MLAVAAPVTIDSERPASAQSRPQINVATLILAEPAVETPLPIQIAANGSLPQQTFLRIRGLPRTATLSEGHSIAPGAWAVPLVALSRLRIATPIGSEGKSEISISLVSIDGTVLSEVKTTLLVAPAALIAPAQEQTVQAQSGKASTTASLGPPAAATPAPVPRVQLERAPTQVPVGPQLKPEERAAAEKHMQRGDENFAIGNIVVARLFYQKAAEIGWGPAALALASTYDPNELARLRVVGGVQADPAVARKWYERARELGAAEAVDRLQRLGLGTR